LRFILLGRESASYSTKKLKEREFERSRRKTNDGEGTQGGLTREGTRNAPIIYKKELEVEQRRIEIRRKKEWPRPRTFCSIANQSLGSRKGYKVSRAERLKSDQKEKTKERKKNKKKKKHTATRKGRTLLRP